MKYIGKEHAQHLIDALGDYEIEIDWKGSKYAGIVDLDFDYRNRKIHLSMLGYVKKACKRFNHEMPKRKQDSPHAHTKPNFGAKVQFAKEVDDSRLLDEEEKTFCATSSRNLPILCQGNRHNNVDTVKCNCRNAVKAN